MVKKSEALIIAEMKITAIKETVKQMKEHHEHRMIELEFSRESERIEHENQMTRQRIKSAEIRRGHERKLDLVKRGHHYG